MSTFQPPPTYAEVVLIDKRTGSPRFNPIWLDWFLRLAQNMTPGGGLPISSIQGDPNLVPYGDPTTGLLTDNANFAFMESDLRLEVKYTQSYGITQKIALDSGETRIIEAGYESIYSELTIPADALMRVEAGANLVIL